VADPRVAFAAAQIVQFTAPAAFPPDLPGRKLQERPSGPCPCKTHAGPV